MATLKEDLKAVLHSLISISNDTDAVRDPIFALQAVIRRVDEDGAVTQDAPPAPEDAPPAGVESSAALAVAPPKSEDAGSPPAVEGFVDGAPVSTPEPEAEPGSVVEPAVEPAEEDFDTGEDIETDDAPVKARKNAAKKKASAK